MNKLKRLSKLLVLACVAFTFMCPFTACIGESGESAYEIAVRYGFEGTEQEWLESLGSGNGKSAYQIAVENGFEGTEEEWLESLKGSNGKSAYQIAVENGFEGTEKEWLDSLKGADGSSIEKPGDGHKHTYSAVQNGDLCDREDGYTVFTCECGDTFTINHYYQHTYVNGYCIYCGIKDAHVFEGYAYAAEVYGDDSKTGQPLSGVNVLLTNASGVTYTAKSGSDGYFRLSEVFNDKYTVVLSAEGYDNIEFNVDLKDNFSKDVYFDASQNTRLGGIVTRADADADPENNQPLSGAIVTLEKITGTNMLKRTVTTGYDGAYVFNNLPVGNYELTVEKEGYISLKQHVTVKTGCGDIDSGILELIDNPESDEDGVASGRIYDYVTDNKEGIAGLTLLVRKDIGNTRGEVVSTITTEYNGGYSLSGLPSGNYTVTVIDNRTLVNQIERYYTTEFAIKVIAGLTITDQDCAVYNDVLRGKMTVVLDWTDRPADLDAHMTGPGTPGELFHIYYASDIYVYDGILYADLDHDETAADGVEVINIYHYMAGKYRFKVHNYTHRSSQNSKVLANSGATVKLYFGGILRYTFYVPEAEGTLWTIFEYDSVTKELLIINEMSYEYGPEDIK